MSMTTPHDKTPTHRDGHHVTKPRTADEKDESKASGEHSATKPRTADEKSETTSDTGNRTAG